MDRETRKANLRKLRLSGIKHHESSTSGSLRKTKSSNGLLSKYFEAPKVNEVIQGNEPKSNEVVHLESGCSIRGLINTGQDHLQAENQQSETQLKTNGRKRTSLRKFVLTEETNPYQCSKDNNEDNFEVPVKKTKIRTNLKRKNNSSRNKRTLSRGQQNIKTLLMRNEVMFSEITSQQCRLDNFSADEIHLAIAMSKSQVETRGSSNFDIADQRVENNEVNLENVQNILGQYGFRPCGLKAYNSLSTALLPGSNRRGRNKWINKYTSLTLRDSKLQAKKVQSKIDFLMSQEWKDKQLFLSETHSESYALFSYNLQKLKPSKAITKAFENEDRINLESFYVKNLFDVNHVQAGYLLKNWHAIEGRELSPQKANQGQNKSNKFVNLMNQSFINLEEHFGVKKVLISTFQPEKNSIPSDDNFRDPTDSTIRTDNEKYSYHIQDNLENCNNNENFVENKMECIEHKQVLSCHGTPLIEKTISTVQDDQSYSSAQADIKQNFLSTSQKPSENLVSISKGTRSQSPNIFASSEDELEEVVIPKMASCNEYETNAYQEAISVVSPLNNTDTTENRNTTSPISSIIDLTQEEEHVSMDGESFKILMENINPNDVSENTDWRTIKENSFDRSENATNTRNLNNLNKSAASSELALSTGKVSIDREDSSEDCIVLSDDEINYSIWRADINSFSQASANGLLNEDDECVVPEPYEMLINTSRLANRSAELLEYGILDNISEPFTQPSEINNSSTHQPELSPTLLAPVGLEGLLNGDISLNNTKEERNTPDVQSYTIPLEVSEYPADEYEISGRIYTTRIVTDPKPEFMHQSESEILKQLYQYGIKPLKRKQAVKLLEFIYNSTHPLILKQTPNCSKQNDNSRIPEQSNKGPSNHIIPPANKLQLKDCFGSQIQLFKNDLQLDLDCEDYIFQTNVTKKTSRPLLPLHIAWHNLVSSSVILNETILTYQPIDLQEIYVFLKEIGYRFDPKDMKAFLDKRCIIFRYDMTQPDRQAERHTRKHKKTTKR
ncbi:structure-specific endonuclease subunit SLX4 isoform X1 [Bactrocera tryoni]|uniref:structure-specific endonuclease subunit SLX4 isoform X1 n=1 Tax=Bactrocera tryoni TaxID=59916 RepID=UPI001A9829FC|nr:structure-specific endonuclease subunit SLX4 isoform X1 [Bactrocera tryoni]